MDDAFENIIATTRDVRDALDLCRRGMNAQIALLDATIADAESGAIDAATFAARVAVIYGLSTAPVPTTFGPATLQ